VGKGGSGTLFSRTKKTKVSEKHMSCSTSVFRRSIQQEDNEVKEMGKCCGQ
jgi:hypothetical protein